MLKVQFHLTGNGVVIHLPGLFEEAEKNLRKGKGTVSQHKGSFQGRFTPPPKKKKKIFVLLKQNWDVL